MSRFIVTGAFVLACLFSSATALASSAGLCWVDTKVLSVDDQQVELRVVRLSKGRNSKYSKRGCRRLLRQKQTVTLSERPSDLLVGDVIRVEHSWDKGFDDGGNPYSSEGWRYAAHLKRVPREPFHKDTTE